VNYGEANDLDRPNLITGSAKDGIARLLPKQRELFEIDESASPSRYVKHQQSAPLDNKVDCAIAALRQFEAAAVKENGYGYCGCFSGGKDSGVIKELARMAGVSVRWRYNVTTIDPPELVRHIRKHHPDVVFNYPDRAMMAAVPLHSTLPTRKGRWCCRDYKERYGDPVRILGVRASEFPRRAANWGVWSAYPKGCWTLAPIVYWTDDDVWTFTKNRKIPYCSLYDEGFERLGCIGCPLIGTDKRIREFQRWPMMQRAWEKAIRRWWDKWNDVPRLDGEQRWYFKTFKTVQEVWNWWVTHDSTDDSCTMGME
jgi:phosphoadenosine phosphosulfate reductase